MEINQYKYTNMWYESTGELIKNYEIGSNDELIPIYLNSKEKKVFFEMKYDLDPEYKRSMRFKKLKRVLKK